MKTRDAPRLPFLPPSLLPLRFCVRTRPLLIFLPLPPERLVCPLLSCYLTIVTTSAAAGSLPVQELVSSEWALQKRLRCGGVARRRRIIVATDCTLLFFLSPRVTCQGRGKGREMCGCGGLVRNSCHCFRGGHFFFFPFYIRMYIDTCQVMARTELCAEPWPPSPPTHPLFHELGLLWGPLH